MRLLLTGATGVAGLNIYRAAVADPSVDSVTLLLRREVPSWAVLPPNASEKTTTIIHSDFTSYPSELIAKLAQHDACIWAQGISSVGVNETDYTHITYESPLAMAKTLKAAGVGAGRPADQPFRFVYISGSGVGTNKQMWAQVKGRAEKDITATCDERAGMKAYILRPGGFHPSSLYPADAKNQRGRTENILTFIGWPVLKLVMPGLLISAEQLGASAVGIAKGLYPDDWKFENKRLVEIATQLGVVTKP